MTGAGDHVIQAGSDQTEDDHQNQAVPDVIWVLAPHLGFDGSHVSADEDTNDRYDVFQ